ncbi:hypothetical protein, partial [Agathobaculum sp.]|uniref:hypothetical protein n=1 Tax=Agathobaculum sp. TaxID=2048138 RepID=UPI003AB2ED72
ALERFHNPKYPQDYIQRIDDILRQKDEIFRLLEQTRAYIIYTPLLSPDKSIWRLPSIVGL